MSRILVSVMIEMIGIAAIGVGIGVEIAYGADWGYIILTVGSVMVAGGGILYAKLLRK